MSANGNGHHWSKFTWRDWHNDVALRSCGLAARGFWIECLCAMHEGNPVGHLTFNGKAATLRQIAVNASCREIEAKKLLAELEENGVFSRSENGTIFCRRMVRDAQASDIGREHADKRWKTKRKHPNGGANGDATPNPNAKESESELEKKNPPRPPRERGGPRAAKNGFDVIWNERYGRATQIDATAEAHAFHERQQVIGHG